MDSSHLSSKKSFISNKDPTPSLCPHTFSKRLTPIKSVSVFILLTRWTIPLTVLHYKESVPRRSAPTCCCCDGQPVTFETWGPTLFKISWIMEAGEEFGNPLCSHGFESRWFGTWPGHDYLEISTVCWLHYSNNTAMNLKSRSFNF